MEVEQNVAEKLALKTRVVIPGELISDYASQFLRGHGTYERDGKLYASICGQVEKVSRLVRVTPLKHRYHGSIGDVVIGRILSVEPNAWKVDLHAPTDARLPLSSVMTGSGKTPRRKTIEDQHKMKEIFDVGDLVVAEVQQILQRDQACSLQTRSMKYGKLKQGVLARVNHSLVRSVKQHFYSFEFGVDIILGKNGFIWVSPKRSRGFSESRGRRRRRRSDRRMKDEEEVEEEEVGGKVRENICRVQNAIKVLEMSEIHIFPETILDVYHNSLEIRPKEMIDQAEKIVQKAVQRIEQMNFQEIISVQETDFDRQVI